MGVSYRTYLGPYFRCKTRAVLRQSMIMACANAACKQHGVAVRNIGYCPRCGTAIDFNFPIEVEATAPHWPEVSEAIHEALTEVASGDADFGDGFHLWVPNVSRPGQPERPSGNPDYAGLEILVDGVDIEAEKRWLSIAFAHEGAKLIDAYGGENVETRWGLLKYCS